MNFQTLIDTAIEDDFNNSYDYKELHRETTLSDRQLDPSVGAFPPLMTSPLLSLRRDELSLRGAAGGRSGAVLLMPLYPESGLLLESTYLDN